jgi:hypothetical protein
VPGNVVRLRDWVNRDTAQLLLFLQEQLEHGGVRGLAVQVVDAAGIERTFFTGEYRRNPTLAVGAGLKMSMRLTLAEARLE